MNLEVGRVHEIAHILNCPTSQLPLKYLGVPLVDKLVKMIAGWRGSSSHTTVD
jgi:hypothetical protein